MRVEQLQPPRGRLGADVGVEGDVGPAGHAALGGDQHRRRWSRASRRWRRPRRPSGCRSLAISSALRLRDRGDALAARVELRDVARDHRDAVDHVERIVAGRDRGRAAHPDAGMRCPGCRRSGSPGRPPPCPGAPRPRWRSAGRPGPRALTDETALASSPAGLGAVADRHDLLQLGHARCQHEVRHGFLAGAHRRPALRRRVADQLHPHGDGARRHAGERYWPLGVGLGARARSPTTETCAPWIGALVGGVGHRASDRPVLGLERRRLVERARTAVASASRTYRVRFMALPREMAFVLPRRDGGPAALRDRSCCPAAADAPAGRWRPSALARQRGNARAARVVHHHFALAQHPPACRRARPRAPCSRRSRPRSGAGRSSTALISRLCRSRRMKCWSTIAPGRKPRPGHDLDPAGVRSRDTRRRSSRWCRPAASGCR